MATTQVFSTPIYFDERAGNNELNSELATLIRKRAASEVSDDAFRAHQGGYYSDGEFFKNQVPCIKEVAGVIRGGLNHYFKDIGVADSIANVALQGWVALTRAGDYQTPHIHRGANISGVYYVNMSSCEPPQGCIDFITPIDVQEATFLYGLARSHCRVVPRSGSLVIFPSYLRHFTHPFKSDDERICVVFNAFVEQRKRRP
jgi:uncharacterized protein (TIGR02466 family)